MKTITNLLLVAFLLLVSACKQAPKSDTSEHEKPITGADTHQKHWSYQGETGPEHWAEIEKNSDCEGQHQSPINIISKDAVKDSSMAPLGIRYSPNTKIHDVVNNGHSIQYNFEKGDYVLFNKDTYDLKQIHFHEAAEHTINGIRYPLEIHMVHLNAKNEFLVLGVLVEEGESSEPFDFLETYLPLKVDETKLVDATFDLNLNFPENKNYYYYQGSLTTPRCTEGVHWFVFKESISISLEQVLALQNLMPLHNYRNERPLNDRIVKQTNF